VKENSEQNQTHGIVYFDVLDVSRNKKVAKLLYLEGTLSPPLVLVVVVMKHRSYFCISEKIFHREKIPSSMNSSHIRYCVTSNGKRSLAERSQVIGTSYNKLFALISVLLCRNELHKKWFILCTIQHA